MTVAITDSPSVTIILNNCDQHHLFEQLWQPSSFWTIVITIIFATWIAFYLWCVETASGAGRPSHPQTDQIGSPAITITICNNWGWGRRKLILAILPSPDRRQVGRCSPGWTARQVSSPTSPEKFNVMLLMLLMLLMLMLLMLMMLLMLLILLQLLVLMLPGCQRWCHCPGWESQEAPTLRRQSCFCFFFIIFLRDCLQKAFPPVIDCDQHHILGDQIVRSINSTCTRPWEREDSHLFKRYSTIFPEKKNKWKWIWPRVEDLQKSLHHV